MSKGYKLLFNIKLLGTIVPVYSVPKEDMVLSQHNNEFVYARADAEKWSIFINEDTPKGMFFSILIHELTHFIVFVYQTKSMKKLDETDIGVISDIFSAIIIDNIDLIDKHVGQLK